MTLLRKISTAFFLAIALSIAAVMSFVTYSVLHNALEDYRDESSQQLALANEYIKMFLTDAQRNVMYLAALPLLDSIDGQLPNYAAMKVETLVPFEAMTPLGQKISRTFEVMRHTHPHYGAVYAAAADDGMLLVPPTPYPAGYDASKKAWYLDTVRDPADSHISNAYRNAAGVAVTSVTARVIHGGKVLGVAGVDILLDTLMGVTQNLRIGKTGYVMLVENTGVILSNPADKNLVFKKIGETSIPLFTRLMQSPDGMQEGEIHGIKKIVNVMTGTGGWKLVSIIDAAEVRNASMAMLEKIAVIGMVLAVLLSGLAWLLVRAAFKPINVLVEASGKIAQGDFNALPEGKGFSGELRAMHASLKRMVEGLVGYIEESKSKAQEAEMLTRQTQQAMQETEEARRTAEKAMRNGMLAAAGQLENVVRIISEASARLSAQIEHSERGSNEQASRICTTAAAVEEMNATVLEVAKNAGTAADVSSTTRNKAEEGADAVRKVVGAIDTVHRDSLALKEDMGTLSEHARNIDQIMNVISDIADQTNLLALNAAIEAARAGEAGRGFAVVAEEVRKLAEKTMASTNDVGEAIRAIQQSAAASGRQVESTVKNVDMATTMSDKCGKTLHEIVRMTDATADQVRAIAASAEEQSAASEEIARSMSEVNGIAGETVKAMQESARVVVELANQAQVLSRLIEDMKKE